MPNTNNTFPTVTSVSQDVAAQAGGQLIGAIEGSLPFILPVLAILFAIRYTLAKIGLN